MVRPLHPVCTDRTISIGIEHGGKGDGRLIPVNLNDGLFNADGIIVEVPVGNVGNVSSRVCLRPLICVKTISSDTISRRVSMSVSVMAWQ